MAQRTFSKKEATIFMVNSGQGWLPAEAVCGSPDGRRHTSMHGRKMFSPNVGAVVVVSSEFEISWYPSYDGCSGLRSIPEGSVMRLLERGNPAVPAKWEVIHPAGAECTLTHPDIQPQQWAWPD